MRRTNLTLCFALVMAGTAWAGYYDPAKPALDVPNEALPFDIFRDRTGDLMIVGDASRETRQRKEVLAARAVLQQVVRPTPAQLVQRGILSLRLRDIDAGFADLHQAARDDRQSFWALTALGTAYEQSGHYVEAVHHLDAARELRPRAWPVPAEEAAAHRTENALLAVARQRMSERFRSGRLQPQLDALFDVKFIGPSGEYEAGKIAPEQAAKLPKDAIATVQQLLFWMPDDARLYWLLGELYNAQGDIDSASAVFEECVGRFDAPDLKRHRQILWEARRRTRRAAANEWIPEQKRWLIAAGLAVPVLAGLAYFQLRQITRRIRNRGA